VTFQSTYPQLRCLLSDALTYRQLKFYISVDISLYLNSFFQCLLDAIVEDLISSVRSVLASDLHKKSRIYCCISLYWKFRMTT